MSFKQPWANAQLRTELSQLLAMSATERNHALVTSSNDRLLELLGEERSKFTQSDKSIMGEMIRMLIVREVYPTEWNGKPINVAERVLGWGANWHKWEGKLECPHCKTDLRNHESGPPFKREIGISAMDRTVSFRCPDCNKEWAR